MNQWQKFEIHPKEPGDQVQRQEDGGQHRQRAHDVVGAAALHAEVNLHRRLGTLLQAAHVVHYALNMLQHVAAAHLQQVSLARLLRRLRVGPSFDGLDPVLQRSTLVLAHLIQVVQGQAGVQQRVPVIKARARVDQLVLPMVKLMGELPAQFQKAINHLVDDAQHQVCRAGRQSSACNAGVDGYGAEQLAGIGVSHDAVSGVDRKQNAVKHSKPDRAGVNALQHGRTTACGRLRHRLTGLGDIRFAFARCQPSENK